MLGHSDIGKATQTKYGDYTVYSGTDILGQSTTADYFYNFWTSLEHPSRKDINPNEMTPYLERLVMMDVLPKGEDFALHVRLIGTFVANFYGEISGNDIRAMPNKQAAARIYSVSKMIVEQKEPLLTITPGFSDDRKYLEALALYMPLFDDKGTVEKIMVCVDIVSLNPKKQLHPA